ncbi:J domain-containing protein [Halorarum halophilum]|uniref:J domain-containing protein n=1 Tax=Halorarum halophilum TaxID=2743090 RepID=A0A7D5KJT8_9EURY|nr:J domain-containing protein [Halobaculum halophilum]QLG26115.1 J domain-containing protein [Halobaculum halophilum]
MDRDPLLLGLAAVFAGISVLMGVLAFDSSLFLLVVALPFGVVSYILWEHATGRLAQRVRESDVSAGDHADAGRGPRASRSRFGREARQRARNGRGREGRARGPGGSGGPTGSPAMDPGMVPAEAYRELDLSPDASQADVKRAYRERVKEAHPDSGGDEEEFKRVNRAYDTLKE